MPPRVLLRAAAFVPCALFAQVSVWTHHNDNFRTGANISETILKRSNVNTNQFGKLFSQPVDGRIYAQPLYVPNAIVRGVPHNVVYVATMENKVYAFDADDNLGGNAEPLWSRTDLGPPFPATDVQFSDSPDISGNIGIMGTPVIDLHGNPQLMYLVARTKEGAAYRQYLHAIDIATGQERPGSPVEIQARIAGTTADAIDGYIHFDPKVQNQRPGLALVNGIVYIAWSGHTDKLPYHGWVIGYNTSDLTQHSVFCDTPNASTGAADCEDEQCFPEFGGAGIWQSGQAPAADAEGHLYFMTGNGLYDEDGKNFGETFVKLGKDGTSPADWYTPSNYQDLNDSDTDLGSGGTLLIPGTGLVAGGGKEGVLYLIDTIRGGAGMGHLAPDENTDPAQKYTASTNHIHSGPAYWDNGAKKLIYVWPEQDYLKVYRLNPDSTLTLDQQSRSADGEGMPGGFLAISANGTEEGVLWVSMPLIEDGNHDETSGLLRAFDASDVTRELWNSRMNPAQDEAGLFAKFCPPTVASGKIYLATFSNELIVYGPRGLRGSRVEPARRGAEDLTALGAGDWMQWSIEEQAPAVNRKKGTGQISYARVGSDCDELEPNSDFRYRFAWSDGTPVAGSLDSAAGVLSRGINCGFSITAPAGVTPRTLALYVGASKAQAKIAAHLSDNGPAEYTDTSLGSESGQDSGMYVFNYAARSDGQTLTVTFTQEAELSPADGAITLAAAWLSEPTGVLNASVTQLPDGAEQDLTVLGAADWAHWGASGFTHKSGGEQISNYLLIGGGETGVVPAPLGFTWNDGAPASEAANDKTAVSVMGQYNGFQITAPADTDERTLTLYVAASLAMGRMVAHLSDWSAPDYADTSVTHGTDGVPAKYTFTYRARSANQTLTVTFTQDTCLTDGSVMLQAAVLSAP